MAQDNMAVGRAGAARRAEFGTHNHEARGAVGSVYEPRAPWRWMPAVAVLT
jgi:hypothetical protein